MQMNFAQVVKEVSIIKGRLDANEPKDIKPCPESDRERNEDRVP